MRARRFALATAILSGCSGAASDRSVSPATPTISERPGAKPTIVLSSDSVVASLVSGAASQTQEIDITRGTEAALTGLAVADSGATASQADWLTVSLSGTESPAKLLVKVSPTTIAPGKYEALLRLTATKAEPRTIRVSLTVRPRPRLVVSRAAVDFLGDVGASFAPQVIDISSVDGAIDSLAIGKPKCGTGPSNWVTPTLSASKTPSSLRLVVDAAALVAGTYTCSVAVSTTQTLVDSATQTVQVSLTLREVPRIALSTDSLTMAAYRLGDASFSVSISNAGSGTLSGLSIGPIKYHAGSDWLSVKLDSTRAPTSLSVIASAKDLPPGAFVATIPIHSSTENVANELKSLVVAFTVLPRPSSLIAIPNVVEVMAQVGGRAALGAVTVTHSGDVPLRDIAFLDFRPTLWWTSLYYSCVDVIVMTPCTVVLRASPPVGVVPGVYTTAVPFRAKADNAETSITFRVTVTP